MALVDRVKNILLTPKTEWPTIAGETATVQSLYTEYILIVAAIGPIVMALSSVLRGSFAGVAIALVSYAIGLAVTYLLALIVDALAPTFGGEKNFIRSLQLTAYSYTAAWVGAIFQIVPVIGGIVGLAAAIYAFYTFYLGVSSMKKCPQDKAAGYTIVIVLCGIVLGAGLMAVLMSVLLGGGIGLAGLGMMR